MEFSISRSTLADALSVLIDVVPLRSSKPILNNILIKGNSDSTITISATDLEIALSFILPVDVMKEPNTILIPSRSFSGIILDEWSSTVKVISNNDQLELNSDNGSFRLSCASADEYPDIPSIEKDAFICLSGRDICDAVKKTAFSVSNDENRYALKGIFIKVEKHTIDFVATNTHRLSLVKKRISNSDSIATEAIVPVKGLSLLNKLAENSDSVNLQLTSKRLVASTSSAVLIVRLIDGQFPRYSDVIPKKFTQKITINKDLFIKTVRLAGEIAREETRAVVISSGNNRLLFDAMDSNTGEGKIEVDAVTDGDIFSAAFNYLYLLDVLRVLDGEEVIINIVDKTHPIVFSENDFTHIIMPIDPKA